MLNERKIETRTRQALVQLGNTAELLEMLPPRTRLTVTIEIVRGEVGVMKDVTWGTSTQKGAHLMDETPISHEEWEKLLSLKPFSESPERRNDLKMRKLLLRFRQEERISHHENIAPVAANINAVLASCKLPYAVVSYKPEGEWYHRKLSKIL